MDKDKQRHKRERMSTEEDFEMAAKRRREDEATTLAALQELLTWLCDELTRRDTNQFFLEPVTDALAPGYSSIITRPVSLRSLRSNIQAGLYTSLPQFEEDVRLMADNSVRYNGPESVYSCEANRLLESVRADLTKERLLALCEHMPNVALLTPAQVGFPLGAGAPPRPDSPGSSGGSTESDAEADAVLASVRRAAGQAAASRQQARPKDTMGYLKAAPDGSVRLTFLQGCGGGEEAGNRPLSLGLVVGKLTAGSASLAHCYDDKRTLAKLVKPVSYGPYSSFCPYYDSTFANLNKEESELLRATYGNESAVQYAESILDFSRDCDNASQLVDNLLDLLTGEQHQCTKQVVNAARDRHVQEQAVAQREAQEARDYSGLRSLAELGIDTSFIDAFEHPPTPLAQSGALVTALQRQQTARLSRPGLAARPTALEQRTADRVVSSLVSTARNLPPSALLPQPL